MVMVRVCFNMREFYKILNTIVLLTIVNVISTFADDFNQQPQIHSYNGELIIRSVPFRNVTFRVKGEGGIFVNSVNVLNAVKKKNMQLRPVHQEEVLTSQSLQALLETFKDDLHTLGARFAILQNRTRSGQTLNIRRSLGRIRRSLSRATQIENNLMINECQEVGGNGTRCKNSGICHDGYKDFHCECVNGWTGKTCEEDVDECYILTGTDLGCQNNGDCINTLGSYSCSCRNGFYGSHCRMRKAICEEEGNRELCVHGTCVHANNDAGYTCICDQGWTKNQVVPEAACNIDINECDEATKPCHSECINLPGSFKCNPCPTGYTGNGIFCSDIDECATNNGGCSTQPKVSCINTEGSYHCGSCPTGWEGDGKICESTAPESCESKNICYFKAKCDYISNTVVCSCPPDMYGHGFGVDGCSVLPSAHPCTNHTCQNNATCEMLGRGTRCICTRGFMGPTCDQADACHSKPCLNGGTCTLLTSNKYRCACPRGTTGSNCEIVRDICGSIIRDRSGSLSYPPDGGNYLPNERCAWIIRTADTLILNITFAKFDLEAAADCNKDWLQLHDGRSLASRLIGRFCGNSLPLGGNIQTSQNAVFFWFRSDNETNGGGVNITWNSMEYICGEVLYLNAESNGIIRSPGYPGKTPPNRECEWRLIAPFGQRFLLRFFEINLGSTRANNCTRDTLRIYDSDLVLKSVCEPSLIEPLHSSSNIIRLRLHTDDFGTDSSFQLHYEVVPSAPNCGGVFTEPSGIITGYINGRICSYVIRQPIDTKIKLEFTELELLKSESCFLQKVEVFDGASDESNLLIRLCGNQRELEPIISSSNVILMRYEYVLPSFRLPKKFEVKYSRVCGGEFINTDDGVFTTPNYPNSYFEHMECAFTIRGPVNSVVHINFTDFSISSNKAHSELGSISPSPLNDSTTLSDDRTFVDVYLSKNNKRRYYEATFLHLVSEKNVMDVVFHGGTNKQNGRGIRVEYHFEEIKCGGVLTEEKGNFSHAAVTEQNCEWVIEAPKGRHIQLELRLWSIVERNSGDVVVDIYTNDTSAEGKLLMSLSGKMKEINEILHVNTVTIILHIKRNLNSILEMNANYKLVDDREACGGNFTARYGVIKTPSWPRPYEDSMDCEWIISAPIGHKIELSIQNFSVETTSKNCNDDYLEIRNGKSSTSPLIGKYCGSSIPVRIPSFTNYLYLHFVSDSYISDTGFYITWQQTETGCGGKLNSYKGSIHSPHNVYVNTGTVSCDWQITVSRGSTIMIYITSFGDDSVLCKQNLLTAYDGLSVNSPRIIFACGNKGNALQLKTSSNQALIIYNFADSDVEDGLQFFIEYETNCNVELDNLNGVIESPNFPDIYPPNLNCFWDIQSGKNNKFQLMFSHLDIEIRDESCDFDYIIFFDLHNDDVLSKQYLCSNPRKAITTEGNRFQIRFVTDYSEPAKGFRLEYKRIGCGEYLSENYGIIKSPHAPYSTGISCDWYIEVAAGKKIVLNFDEIHIETERDDCSDDGIIVSEEKNSTNMLLKECRIDQGPVTITSQANHLYIHFYTSSIRTKKYISASYTARDSSCGGIFQGNNGQITYPTPGGLSGITKECVWLITVENSYGINLIFDHFNISCNDTFLGLWKVDVSSEALLEKTCGDTVPASRLIQSNRMKVVYKVNASGSAQFSFKFKKACGGHLTDSFGYIKSRLDEKCEWKIESEGTYIFLDILHLECDCSKQENCTNGLRLIDGNGKNELNKFCDSHQSNIALSTNALDIYASKIEFKAKYSIVQSSCGGVLTSLRGILTSPFYPQSYPSNVECMWEIKAAAGNHVELMVESLDIMNSENCNQDFLEIRQSNERGQIIRLYCSNETVTEKIVLFENAWIKFRSVEGSTGNGFKLAWNYAHNNELHSTAGSIESPPLNSIFNQETYTWRILLPRGNFISLNFKEYNRGLKLYDGFDDLALEIPIPDSPWQYTSSSNVLYLVSINNELDAFKIGWKTVSNSGAQTNLSRNDCNRTFVINYSNRLNISSPGYPNGYAHNLDCEWIIKPEDSTEHIVLNLYEVKLETYGESDYLQILTSTNLIDWHKELDISDSNDISIIPIKVIQGTPYLKLVLHTDFSFNRTGFTSLAKTACGSNMTALAGQILGTNVMRSLNPNSYCIWHIEVPTGRKIALRLDFGKNIVPIAKTCRQYAIVYDGFDDNAPILPPGHICNQEGRNVKNLESSTNRLTIKYNLNWTNPFEKDLDFNMTYQAIAECDTEIQLTHYLSSINISSPNYPNVPNPHTECNWIIIGPVGETLQVEFLGHFSFNTRYCKKEFIEIFDGSTELARSFGRFCTKPNTIRSTGNILRLHYLTDLNEPRNGFQANVSIANCGGTYADLVGEITSNGYPEIGAYPKPAVCDYTIKMPTRSRMRLNFSDLDLAYERSNINRSDRIEIVTLSENPETVTVLYGNSTIMPVLDIDTNAVTLRFVTFPGSYLHRGFKLRFQRLYGLCYREVDNDSGILSLSTLDQEPIYVSCRWKIKVPKGQRVTFEFQKFEAQSVVNNTERFILQTSLHRNALIQKISFYNDPDMLSKITEVDINNFNLSQQIVSSDNFMYVRFDIHRRLSSIRILQARYSSNEESPCPPDINKQISGSLDTNRLPWNTNFFCTSRFILSGFETITFKIGEIVVYRNNPFHNPYAIRFQDESLLMPYKMIFTNITDIEVSLSSKGGMLNMLQNDDIKISRFSVEFHRHPCGGSFNVAKDFKIIFPPENVVHNGDEHHIECAWTIRGASERRPYKLLGNISLIDDCSKEFISIYSGMTPELPQIAKICHNSTELISGINLKKHLTTILYHSEEPRASTSFQITAKASITCGSKTMVVISPPPVSVDSKTYKNNMECSWEFETSHGLYLIVNFLGRFFIEKSENCSKDYLEIYFYENNIWNPKERFCGREVPSTYNATSHRILIVFRTDNTTTGDGFTFRVSSACITTFHVTNQLQVVRTPDAESTPYSRFQCSYTFVSNSDKAIRLQIKNSGYTHVRRPIFKNRSCPLGFIAYKKDEEGNEIKAGEYCEATEILEYRYLRLTIITVYEAFQIAYQLNSCGGNISQSTVIRSLSATNVESGNDYLYADNMNCIWNIMAPSDHSILVRFKYFDMEKNEKCSLDFVTIYLPRTENELIKLCGNLSANPPLVLVDGSQAVIAAVSDNSYAKKGFQADILFVRNCNERIALTNDDSVAQQLIMIRNYTVNSTEELHCQIRVTAPESYRVKIQIRNLDINQARCPDERCAQCNYLEVIEGADKSDTTLSMGKFCTNNETKRKLITSNEHALLQFSFTRQGNYTPEIVLEIEKSVCGRRNELELQSEKVITIQFPPEGAVYPPNAHCKWRIKSETHFQIHFEYMLLQKPSAETGQCVDYLRIAHDKRTDNYCGNSTGFTKYITKPRGHRDDYTDLTFHSDDSVEDKGFKITVSTQQPCNRTHTRLSEFIDFKPQKTSNQTCVADIKVPDNYTINLYVRMFTSEYVEWNCSNPNFQINDTTINKNLRSHCISYFYEDHIHTNISAAHIYTRSLDNFQMFYFASHRSSEPGCGGEIYTIQGVISSPSYEHRNFSECRWDISVPEPNRIEVVFTTFDMGSKVNCDLDYVSIIEISPSGEEKVTKNVCADQSIDEFISKTSRVAIVSKKSPNFNGNGWRLKFQQFY
ncbi:cubilin homolog [Anastrepha ludens]|uniref:cubilin homolog n=1 Tax=Anastrepha ludens TaxID=28586 RepID=UPI0023AFFFEA|nr:cubilin homolog [Anastrepha ludens]